MALLRGELQPLFAILDAARDPNILKLLLDSKEQFQSLYQGKQGEALVHFAPYLVRLPQPSPLIEKLVLNGWGKSWGVYLTCDQPFEAVRTHFRRFLMVKTEAGKHIYFRFYDPRVLRVFLPSCTVEQLNLFFGPVSNYRMESQTSQGMHVFAKLGQKFQSTVVPLYGS